MSNRNTRRPSPNWAAEHLPLEELLNREVIGQPKACELMAGLMASTLTRQRVNCGIPLPRVLVTGPTSSGKSYLAEQVAKYLQVPTAIVNAATLTSPGYKGTNLSDALAPILRKQRTRMGNDPSLIIIDELDKLILRSKDDKWIKQVEYNLWPILNSDPIRIPDGDWGSSTVELHTSNALILAMGVFDGIKVSSWKNYASSQKALHRFGFGSEFVSRFSHFVRLDKPTRANMKKLVEREVRNAGQLYAINGWTPDITPRQLCSLTCKAINSPYGIRGIRGEIHELLFKEAKSTPMDMIV